LIASFKPPSSSTGLAGAVVGGDVVGATVVTAVLGRVETGATVVVVVAAVVVTGAAEVTTGVGAATLVDPEQAVRATTSAVAAELFKRITSMTVTETRPFGNHSAWFLRH
jgi:hypothetical protein